MSKQMTPEQRAAEIVSKWCADTGTGRNPISRLEELIAAALQPSAAVRQLVAAYDEAIAVLHLIDCDCDAWETCPVSLQCEWMTIRNAARKELGL